MGVLGGRGVVFDGGFCYNLNNQIMSPKRYLFLEMTTQKKKKQGCLGPQAEKQKDLYPSELHDGDLTLDPSENMVAQVYHVNKLRDHLW